MENTTKIMIRAAKRMQDDGWWPKTDTDYTPSATSITLQLVGEFVKAIASAPFSK
jgi:hypothetical protein